jgi:TonB family protein
MMQQAGVEGMVVLQGVVDTSGRIERESVEVISSTQRAFDGPAMQLLRRCIFRPGRVRGSAVRVLVQLPVQFTLIGGGQ